MPRPLESKLEQIIKICGIYNIGEGELSSTIVWGTMLQADSLQVQFPIRSFSFSVQFSSVQSQPEKL
jgi:hypothetical protein